MRGYMGESVPAKSSEYLVEWALNMHIFAFLLTAYHRNLLLKATLKVALLIDRRRTNTKDLKACLSSGYLGDRCVDVSCPFMLYAHYPTWIRHG